MDNSTDLKQLIITSRSEAMHHIDNIKHSMHLTPNYLLYELSEYIRCKYLLEHKDMTTDNFTELTKISMAKSMKISKDLVEEFDMAKSCDGVSSLMAKKVLLLMSIQKSLGIKLPGDKIAESETLSDICIIVWDALNYRYYKA